MTDDHTGHHAHSADHDQPESGDTFLQRVRAFFGHGHSHGDLAFIAHTESDPPVTTDAGMRALVFSLAGLGVTSALQLVIVLVSHSVALLADTIHNVADALTAIPLGVAFWLGRRVATRRYTYGFGRAEDLAGIAIVGAIAASSVLAGWEAIARLVHPRSVHQVGWVIAAGLVGFAGKELVAQYRIQVGRSIGSAALVADGLHARTDGITSLAVAVGGIGVAAGFTLADPIVGLLITIAIVLILKDAAREIYRRLMDSVDPALVDRIEDVLRQAHGIEDVESVRVRWVGRQLFAEVTVVSDCDLSLARAHAIAESAHHELLHAVPRLAEVTIHTNPCDHDGVESHPVVAHHFPLRDVPGEAARPSPESGQAPGG